MASRNPDWTEDELVLALDVYNRVGAGALSDTHSEVMRLSALLNQLAIHPPDRRSARFRTRDGVRRRLGYFAQIERGEGPEDRPLYAEVWARYEGDRSRLARDAAEIVARYSTESEDTVVLFDGDDAAFTAWMVANTDGHVLNVSRHEGSGYSWLHRAGCPHFTGLPAETDPFTGGEYVKACAESVEALAAWAAEHRPRTRDRLRACGDCAPALTDLVTGVGQSIGTAPAYAWPLISYDEVLGALRARQGRTLRTVTGKRYSVEVDGEIVRFTPSKSGEPREVGWSELTRTVEEYNATGTLRQQQYHTFGVNASYLLPVIRGITGVGQVHSNPDPPTPVAADAGEPSQPDRVQQTVSRIVRDTALARRVKAERGYRCELCGDAVYLGDGKPYVEAHHVRPLGSPHDGPDEAANLLVVCPTHHALLDFGAVSLVASALPHVRPEHVRHHNEGVVRVCGLS